MPSTEVLEVKMVTDRPDAANFLELGEDKRLIHLCRLRSANDRKLVVVDTWLSYGRFRTLMNEDFASKSLYGLLEAKYGVRVDRAVRQFEAADASPEDAWMLEMEPGRAICRVQTRAYSGDEPIEFSLARYRGDRNIFTVELFR